MATLVTIFGVVPAFGQTANEIDIAVGAGSSANAACVAANDCFSPNPLTVSQGTTVTWKNTDTMMHVICSGTSTDAACGTVFEDDSLKPGQTFQFTFANAGTYNYFCSVHPWMTGQVIVSSNVSNTPTPMSTLSISTDRSSYSQGDIIILTGHVTNMQDSKAITLKIVNSDQNIVSLVQIVPSSDGSFTQTFSTTGTLWSHAGTYSLVAQYGNDVEATGTFYFNGGTTTTPYGQAGNEIDIATGAGASANAACVSANDCFYPNPLTVSPGTTVTWRNTDTAMHVICSGYASDPQCGTVFEDDSLRPGSTFQFTFANSGTYNYFCSVHPWMTGQVIVSGNSQNQAPSPPPVQQPIPPPPTGANVIMTQGAGSSANAACVAANNCFSPNVFSASQGQTVTWYNDDTVGHYISSGNPSDTTTGTVFDSGNLIKPGGTFQFTFANAGTYNYFCSVHPWMTGQIVVGVSNQPSGTLKKAIPVDGTSFSILYSATNGKILGIKADMQAKALIVSIQTTGDGVFTATLPRALINAILPNGQDDKYYVLLDNQEVSFQETSTTTTDRTLSIPFTDGTQEIEIIGTQLEAGETSSQFTSSSGFTPTPQDIQNINQAKTSQTIAAEVNVGSNQAQTTSIDNNVSVQTTMDNSDSLDAKVSASSQTGPKVIAFNLEATTINVANLKDLGVMYDGKLIQPAPNIDAILHAKSTDNPSFAIVVTQSGVQVLVLVPHFSTHTITLTNMSKVISTVPEFPFAILALIIATFAIVLIPKIRHI